MLREVFNSDEEYNSNYNKKNKSIIIIQEKDEVYNNNKNIIINNISWIFKQFFYECYGKVH